MTNMLNKENMSTKVQTALFIGCVVLLSRLLFMGEIFYNVDEAIYAVGASIWLKGIVPLLGSWGNTTKPPGMEFVYMLVFKLGGESILALRVANLLCIYGITFFVYAISNLLFGRKAALISGILLPVAMCSSFNFENLVAFNAEIPQMLLVLIGTYLFLLGFKKNFLLNLFIAGIFSVLAVLIRQNSILHFGALLIYLLFFSGCQIAAKRRIQGGLMMLAGAIVGLLPIVFYYARINGLYELWYYSMVFPFQYASDLAIVRVLYKMLYSASGFVSRTLPVTAFALVFLATKESKVRQNGFEDFNSKAFIAIWFIFCALSVSLGGRFFGHYFIQVMPALCVLGGAGGAVLWEEGKNIPAFRVFIVAVMALYLIVGLLIPNMEAAKMIYDKETRTKFSLTDKELEKVVGKYIEENSAPDDKLFVWGFCSQIFWHSHRMPAAKDYLCVFATGYSPGAFDPQKGKSPRSNGVKDAERIMYDDLDKNSPKFIVDLSRVWNYQNTFKFYPISDYPLIDSFIKGRYHQVKKFDDVVVYERNQL